jgi:hypothetical protein
MMSNREESLRRRIRVLTRIFIIGLLVSGATAIPLGAELNLLVRMFPATNAPGGGASGFAGWILRVRNAVQDTNAHYPFLAYGTDWLAFGHFVIAVAFIGALRDPVRNVWLFTFGLIACAMIIPYAFIFGAVRGIPLGWRLIDCSFGVFGIIPVWYCRRWTGELASLAARAGSGTASL